MRYTNVRKYPITHMKRNNLQRRDDRVIDLSLGVAAGLLGLVFLEGMFWGYMIKKMR